MSSITIVSSSLRVKSTSRTILEEVVKGLKENNHDVKLIDLRNIEMKFCQGCMACQKLGRCVIKDDINDILPIINDSDVLIFVSPIYYYSISGQLKTFLDRMNALYSSETRKFQKVYAVFTCADDQPGAVEGPKKAIEGWVECFEGAELADVFTGFALNEVGDIDQAILEKAHVFGKSI